MINRYKEILENIKNSDNSVSEYCKQNGINAGKIHNFIQAAQAQQDTASVNELINVYSEITKDPIDSDTKASVVYIRDDNDKITEYEVEVLVRDKKPFKVTLSREDAEVIFGLYTYYGGNITARNVANEFPKFTLADIKKIFRAFRLTKDSSWAPPHLLEELTINELNEYRLALKERAAFKYADSRQERDYKNIINKLALQIEKLEDRNEFIKELINSGQDYKEYKIESLESSLKTGIIVLSDLHVGACNVANGYLPLVEYNDAEITNRLNKILDFIAKQSWNNLIIINLGDSIDNYRGTTAKGTPLPTNMTEKQAAKMYLEIMENWFHNLKNIFDGEIQYICVGDSNHGASYDWITNVALIAKVEQLGINCYVSEDAIDSFNVGEFTITYLHGHDSRTQFKGFPLNLDEKTKNWFNNYFLQAKFNFKNRKIVLKGDLHQYNVNSCNTFDYINAPSIYGSSAYIVGNYGKGKEGALYLEIDKDKYTTGVIWNE